MAVFFFYRSAVPTSSLFSMRASTQTLFAPGGVTTLMQAYFSCSAEYQTDLGLDAFRTVVGCCQRCQKKRRDQAIVRTPPSSLGSCQSVPPTRRAQFPQPQILVERLESSQTKITKLKSPNTSLQARVTKPNVLRQSFHAEVPKRKFPKLQLASKRREAKSSKRKVPVKFARQKIPNESC